MEGGSHDASFTIECTVGFHDRSTLLPPRTVTCPAASTTPPRRGLLLVGEGLHGQKYAASSDPDFKVRAVLIKEERCELVKHHLWVLWTDYFKVEHLKQYPNLHDLFWMATKSVPAKPRRPRTSLSPIALSSEIDAIAQIFWATKK